MSKPDLYRRTRAAKRKVRKFRMKGKVAETFVNHAQAQAKKTP